VSAPVIVVLPQGVHLADAGATFAWCGVRVDGGVSFAFEPGSDFGEGKNDCRKCLSILEGKR